MAVVFLSRYCSDLVIMEDFVIITEFEGGENIEVDVEDDGRLTISSIQSQFGKDVTGLRYKMLPLAIITGVSFFQCSPFFPSCINTRVACQEHVNCLTQPVHLHGLPYHG